MVEYGLADISLPYNLLTGSSILQNIPLNLSSIDMAIFPKCSCTLALIMDKVSTGFMIIKPTLKICLILALIAASLQLNLILNYSKIGLEPSPSFSQGNTVKIYLKCQDLKLPLKDGLSNKIPILLC